MAAEDARRSSAESTTTESAADTLSPPLTIQESATTREAVLELRKWAAEAAEFDHCVISGPPGSGRTHLLEGLAGILPSDQTLVFAPSDSDRRATVLIKDRNGARLLIDDLDRYEGGFLKDVLPAARARQHHIVAVTHTFGGRLQRQWEANLSRPREVRLAALDERVEDLTAFLPHWAARSGHSVPEGAAFSGTGQLLAAMKLPYGFVDLLRLLDELAALGVRFWDPPDAPALVKAYARTVVGPRSSKPVILVEGITDAIYLQWVSDLVTDSPPDDVEIESCQSASKIPQRAFACRNEGRSSIALFDRDRLGGDLHEQMQQFGLGSIVIPDRLDPLAGCARDHVLQVVEIEDLLPVAELERFLAETGRRAELVIEAPRQQLRRLVIHAEDKLELAKWVRSKLGTESAEQILEVYNALRQKLGLPPVAFPEQRAKEGRD